MSQSKEQLMTDIALLIKAHDQKEFQNKLIRQEEREIKHLTLKQVKKKNRLMLLLPSLVIIFISMFIFHSSGLLGIGLILLVVWFFKNKNIQRHQNTITEIHQTVVASNAQQRIPKSYTHIHALRSMFNYLYNQRADNLKEAINLYETESHQARMEGQQKQILSTVTQTSVDAKAAKYASELAATNSQASAVWAERATHSAKSANENAADASRKAEAAAADAYMARKNTTK